MGMPPRTYIFKEEAQNPGFDCKGSTDWYKCRFYFTYLLFLLGLFYFEWSSPNAMFSPQSLLFYCAILQGVRFFQKIYRALQKKKPVLRYQSPFSHLQEAYASFRLKKQLNHHWAQPFATNNICAILNKIKIEAIMLEYTCESKERKKCVSLECLSTHVVNNVSSVFQNLQELGWGPAREMGKPSQVQTTTQLQPHTYSTLFQIELLPRFPCRQGIGHYKYST